MLRDLLWVPVQDSTRGAWTDAAIRDSVAAIIKRSAYQRGVGETLWSRITRWVFDRLAELFDAASKIPYGRAIGIVLLIAIVCLVVARIVMGIRDERRPAGAARKLRFGATDEIIIEDADRLAAQGNYTAAVHALFTALLSASAARGEIRLHPSKTSGDYARELRRKNAPWIRSFQSFRVLYDRIVFGDLHCTAQEYNVLAREVRAVLRGAQAA